MKSGKNMATLDRFKFFFNRKGTSATGGEGGGNSAGSSTATPKSPFEGGIHALRFESPRYKPIKVLGSGSYGQVVLAMREADNVAVAIKLMSRGPKIQDRVLREVRNHKRLDHPNVVKFHEVFLTRSYLCIVMDYAPGRNLLEYVLKKRYLEEDHARKVFQQLIMAVHYCHAVGIVNRDIKLDNTLLDDHTPPGIMICDFGYSKSDLDDSLPDSRIGTPQYLAPEVFSLGRGESYCAKTSDVWACGVFLYALLTGKYPFAHADDKKSGGSGLAKLMVRVLKGEFGMPTNMVSEEGCHLLRQMLTVKVEERITIEQIKDHPWFAKDLEDDFHENWDCCQPRISSDESDDELERIVDQAKTPSPIDDDQTIHASMEEDGHDGSWIITK